jgi:glyoxylase-like metal-dependent hydrolase (beta-lactamase superfamily II)
MKKITSVIALLLGLITFSFAQSAEKTASKTSNQNDSYEVFAVKFATLNFTLPLTALAVGTSSKDSTNLCYMVYLLKGKNGRTVLVDAGFTETPPMYSMQAFTYIRPDSMLMKMNINPTDITDLVITHPHWDHIGGIDLFPNAMVWMQKEDFNYFVGTAWQKGEDPNNGFNSKDVLKIIQKNIDKKLTLVKGDDIEIIPGIKVFIGSKHTFESQWLLVNTDSDKAIIASDNTWLYYNLNNLLSIPLTFDQKAYIENLKRMKTMVKNTDWIIPGHDPLVFSKFPKVIENVVKIKN